jgi:hypothetical protein
MKRVLALTLLFALPTSAIDTDCPEITHLGALYQLRALMTRGATSEYDVQRFIDRRVDELREPLRDGGHRWIRWVRPAGDGPVVKREHSVRAVQGDAALDRVEGNASNVFSASVVVPRKRSLVRENNPVWVGVLEVTYELDGRPATKREAINQWMNPGTSRTIDFAIADRASARADVSTAAKHVKQALVEIHLRQAVAEDDPANPAYPTIRTLLRIRENPDPPTVDAEIAAAETALFPGSDSLPWLTILADLRLAEELMNSGKLEEHDKGAKLLKETLRRLR